ncbi:MAG: glycosyltransferase family 2 protein, partial [Sphaerochaeta sp.]
MILFASLISILGLWATLLSFSNRRYMERLKKATPQVEDILVTIAIPARNEEANIVRCVSSLMQQSYKHIEILVLDDNSTDATAKLVEELALTDTRIHLLKGKPLQDGWRGKLYGMQQLFEESKGKYILYTDADTIHSPDSVQYGLNIIEHEQASMLSGYP